ncbi:MAG TPA: fatty acid desaturase [Kofleriaceae bacterium]
MLRASPGRSDCEARHPWQRSWLYHAPAQRGTMLWIFAVHLAALVGLIAASRPSPALVLGALALNLPGALGLTLGFHRSIAHRAVTFAPWLEQLLILCAMFNGSGSPRSWASAHHLHHRYEDTLGDVSSPVVGGFWWAHLRWLWQMDRIPDDRIAVRLHAPRYARWEKWQPYILLVAVALPIYLGFTAWVWLAPVRLVYILHAQCLVNSAAHMGARGAHGGTSKNLVWLAPIHYFLGENWHHSHHMNQASARMGDRWWHIDLAWQVVRALGALGLATRIGHGRTHDGVTLLRHPP